MKFRLFIFCFVDSGDIDIKKLVANAVSESVKKSTKYETNEYKPKSAEFFKGVARV